MVDNIKIDLPPYPRGIHLITDEVFKNIQGFPQEGLIHIFLKHTSAALTLNENADPSVRSDMKKGLDKLAPENEPWYEHTAEGPDDMPAHIKTALVGPSLTMPIDRGKPDLGTWQGIYLLEFRDNAPGRKLVITIIS